MLDAAGVGVYVMPGFVGRGREMGAVRGVVGHDTVTRPTTADEAVDRLLRDGHSSLRGPLSQAGLDRAGVWRLIADGRCNHNGYGSPWGNDAVGVEVYVRGGVAGEEEAWSDVQRESFVVGTAAILAYLRLAHTRVHGHKEQDPRRKIDPWGVDMSAVRAAVARAMSGRLPRFEEDVMKVGHADVAQVQVLQWRLNQVHPDHPTLPSGDRPADPQGAGLGYGLVVDGVFGPATEAYVRDVQSRFGYEPHGVVDLATYMRIFERLVQLGVIRAQGRAA